jgi:hypothetical protein
MEIQFQPINLESSVFLCHKKTKNEILQNINITRSFVAREETRFRVRKGLGEYMDLSES